MSALEVERCGGCGMAIAGQIAVTTAGLTFQPRSVAAQVGTTVMWTINSAGTHTVTSDTGLFDSGNLTQGGTFSFSFNKPGTYNYHCTFHAGVGMVGTITVPGSAHDFSGDNLSSSAALE